MFLTDPLSQPTEERMKTWIDFTRWMKQGALPGDFDFFTYTELLYWFAFVILVNPFRWKWALFFFLVSDELCHWKWLERRLSAKSCKANATKSCSRAFGAVRRHLLFGIDSERLKRDPTAINGHSKVYCNGSLSVIINVR